MRRVVITLAISLVAEAAAAQSYTCPRPTGWSALSALTCKGGDCTTSTKAAQDSLMRPVYMLNITPTHMVISGAASDVPGVPPWTREVPITWRDAERAAALAVTEKGAQLFQFFFEGQTLHWVDSYRLMLAPAFELQAFTSNCKSVK